MDKQGFFQQKWGSVSRLLVLQARGRCRATGCDFDTDLSSSQYVWLGLLSLVFRVLFVGKIASARFTSSQKWGFYGFFPCLPKSNKPPIMGCMMISFVIVWDKQGDNLRILWNTEFSICAVSDGFVNLLFCHRNWRSLGWAVKWTCMSWRFPLSIRRCRVWFLRYGSSITPW